MCSFPSPLLAMDKFCRLGLQCRAAPLGFSDAVVPGGRLEFGKRGNAEIPIEPKHLVGTNSWHGQHLKNTCRDFFPQFFQAWMSACVMELGDGLGDRIADAGDFCEPVLFD
jgi:hypothetical protein